MLRVNSQNVLVVPPFECAWLALSDYGLNGRVCLQFECKGDNDVTIIFKTQPGAKRWQPLQRQQGPAGEQQVEENYTVILGSHRNRCLKVERNGVTQLLADSVPGARVTACGFTRYWINYEAGVLSAGSGDPDSCCPAVHWQDPQEPIPGIQYVGLSCWDSYVSYRAVSMRTPLDVHQLRAAAAAAPAATAAAAATQHVGCSPPSLFHLVLEGVAASLGRTGFCALLQALQVSELLAPAAEGLYQAAVGQLARSFLEVAAQQPCVLAALSGDALSDVLCDPLLDAPERLVFEVIASWCRPWDATSLARAATLAAAALHERAAAARAAAGQAVEPGGGVCSSSTCSSSCCCCSGGGSVDGAVGSRHAVGTQLGSAGTHRACCCGVLADMAARSMNEQDRLLQLVRFALMPEADLQDVRSHPLAQHHPLVLQLVTADVTVAAAAHQLACCSGNAGGAGAAAAASYCVDKTRLLRLPPQLPSLPPPPPAPHPSAAPLDASTYAAPAPGAATDADTAPEHTLAPPAAQAAPGADAAPERPLQLTTARYQRRLGQGCVELMYVCDGDRNGVVAHLATHYGTKPWVNPVLARRLEVKASSPVARHTDPKVIVSGRFAATSFAGPRYERGVPLTWWMLDLGGRHRLLCNYYTLRQDGSGDFARHWVLQGSNDLAHWHDLRVHTADSSLRLPGQYASWPVGGLAASTPFRAFRVMLTGPTTSVTAPWNLCLCHLELYGYFYGQQQQQAPQQLQAGSELGSELGSEARVRAGVRAGAVAA